MKFTYSYKTKEGEAKKISYEDKTREDANIKFESDYPSVKWFETNITT